MGTAREHQNLIVARSIYPPSTFFYPPPTCMCYLTAGLQQMFHASTPYLAGYLMKYLGSLIRFPPPLLERLM